MVVLLEIASKAGGAGGFPLDGSHQCASSCASQVSSCDDDDDRAGANYRRETSARSDHNGSQIISAASIAVAAMVAQIGCHCKAVC